MEIIKVFTIFWLLIFHKTVLLSIDGAAFWTVMLYIHVHVICITHQQQNHATCLN